MKLSKRVALAEITMKAEMVGENLQGDWPHTEWSLHLARQGKSMQVTFQYGARAGHPELDDVMDTMLLIARHVEGTSGYEEWAREFTSDPAEFMPKDTYRLQVQQTKRLKEFLGADTWDAWLYETETD